MPVFSDKRFRFGIAASVVWLLVVASLLLNDWATLAKLAPNEWGDFFAGVFSPLAFLWLVLGYLQQGEELKLSTRALLLQAEELKNSVQQQRELVEVSRLQVESEREALTFERRLREDAARPILLVAGAGGAFRGDGQCTYNLSIANVGAAVTALLLKIKLPGGSLPTLLDLPIFDKGARHSTSFTVLSTLHGSETTLHVSCTDALGRQAEFSYLVERESDAPDSQAKFTRVEA